METDKNVTLPGKTAPVEDAGAKKNSFAEHGNEIDEIISKKPSFIVRFGTVFFLCLLLLISVICWFIQYPDIVIAKARLSSINAPKEVVARTGGKLVNILVKENDVVEKGEIMAYIESVAKPTAVSEVSRQIDSINNLIRQNKTNEIISYFPDYSSQKYLSDLGELQSSYQTFIRAFITFKDFISNGFYLRKKKMLSTDMQNIQKLHIILAVQKDLLQQDVSLSNETFHANESLVKDKVISPLDYRNEKSKLIAKQLSLPQINASIISNESQQNEKIKEITELENQIVVQKNSFIQAVLTFKSEVESWEYKYILKAPVSGRVGFAGFFQENQEIKAGVTLFYVAPPNSSYFVEMLVPQYNFGKVRTGQKVLLRFQAFPYEQFGSIIGTIESMNSSPSDSGYLAKVNLPAGLITNYKKQLQYRDGLFAQADIITEDIRLLERFYYSISKRFNRQ